MCVITWDSKIVPSCQARVLKDKPVRGWLVMILFNSLYSVAVMVNHQGNVGCCKAKKNKLKTLLPSQGTLPVLLFVNNLKIDMEGIQPYESRGHESPCTFSVLQ